MEDDIYSPSLGSTPITADSAKAPKGAINKFSAGLIDFIQTLVIFGAIFAIIYLFIAQPHKVSGSSMYPTFYNGDYILTDKISYRFTNPKDGEVVVLKDPRDESIDFIKRIIGTPGETIKVQGDQVYRNGTPVSEPYLQPNVLTQPGAFLHEGQSYTLEPNHYLVFGDNREHSSDSREWGTVSRSEIIGRVVFRYFPLNRFGIIHYFPSS